MLGQILKSTIGLPGNMLAVQKPEPNTTDPKEQQKQDSEGSVKHHYRQVELSSAAKNLNNVADDAGVDWQGVETLGSRLSQSLDAVFTQYGIDTSKPININVNPFTGMPFVGDHPDKVRIAQLLQNKPELMKQIQTINSVANYSYQSTQRDSSQSAAPTTPQASRVQSALNQYTQNSQNSLVSLQFDKLNGLIVNVDNHSVTSKPAESA